MKRKIVKIDEKKCNGCGECIINCPEGALQVIDGKARVVSETACDGLGACIGHCPLGAITVEERDAEAYSERKVMERMIQAGEKTIRAHLSHLKEHGEEAYYQEAVSFLKERGLVMNEHNSNSGHSFHSGGGCPGSRIIDRRLQAGAPAVEGAAGPSQLRQWPVQLALLNPRAPYFENADLLVAADCVPFAYANFHNRFLKEKSVVVFCPKLDEDIQGYIDKLAEIIRGHSVRSVSVVRMEVPCCGGATHILEEAVKQSGKNLVIREHIISLNGEIV